MLSKEKIKNSIDSFLYNWMIYKVIDQLILLDKVEQGLKDIEDGNVFTSEEVKSKFNKWLL